MKHWQILTEDQETRPIFSKRPLCAFRRDKNLNNQLVSATLHSDVSHTAGVAILCVGVTCARYVSLRNCRIWVIHSYRNLKGRGLHAEEDGSNTNIQDVIGDREGSAIVSDGTPVDSMDEVTVLPEDDVDTALPEDKVDTALPKDKMNTSESVSRPGTTIPESMETAACSDIHVKQTAVSSDETQVHLSDYTKEYSEEQAHGILESEPKRNDQPVKSLTQLTDTECSFEEKQDIYNEDETHTGDDSNIPMKFRKLNDGTAAVEHQKASKDTVDETSSETEQMDAVAGGSSQSQAGLKADVVPESEQLQTAEDKGKSGMELRQGKKRKHPDNLEKEKSDVIFGNSTYDRVRLIIQPWRKPEGGVNKTILKMMMESMMLFLMMNPGSTEKTLLKRYQPYLQPMVIHRIVQILEDIGCVTCQTIKVGKASLFSQPTLPVVDGEESEDATKLYTATEECLFRMGQFGKEMFPNTEWPSSTTYLGRV